MQKSNMGSVLISLIQFLLEKSLWNRFKKVNRYSVIKADYLLENIFYNQSVYLFLGARARDKGEQMCRTFFLKQEKDYTIGQPKYTLLKKEKLNVETGDIIVQYNRLGE